MNPIQLEMIKSPLPPEVYRADYFIVMGYWKPGKWWTVFKNMFLEIEKAEKFVDYKYQKGWWHLKIYKINGSGL